MKKKTRNPFRKALVVSLIKQGNLNTKQIAAQAQCTPAYVHQIRYRLKKSDTIVKQAVGAVFTLAEPTTERFPAWLVGLAVFVSAAATSALIYLALTFKE